MRSIVEGRGIGDSLEWKVWVNLLDPALYNKRGNRYGISRLFFHNLGNRQYSLKTNYMARIIKHHNYRKFIKEFDHMTFANPDS